MLLVPTPRRLLLTDGHLVLPRTGYIRLLASPADLLPAANALRRALLEYAQLDYSIVAAGPDVDVVFDLLLSDPLGDQAYEIEIQPRRAIVTAGSPQAAFWAAQTLTQILRQHPQRLPCLEIDDKPDYRVRGVMLDVSRDKVPTMPTLYQLVDQFAELKINHLQLYTEHTFAYRNHPDVWKDASPVTGQEILELEKYCADRFIELVPNQNSFGHMERWLRHPRYAPLAECPDGFTFPWGFRHEGGFSLNPTDPKSLQLVEELYEELLPHFTSPLFNVGCDETFDLGLGKSKEECERRGKGRVYLDFLLEIHKLLQNHQRMMMFWGDIIIHHPELLDQLPRDVIALEWGYEADHPFEDHLAKIEKSGIPVFVCPGTSSWCSITGRTDNALANLIRASDAGLNHDAAGYLITDWGDWGHHQPLPVSYLGFTAGAAYAWCAHANRNLKIADALDLHVFKDKSRIMGRLAMDLGSIHQVFNKPLHNGTRLFWALLGTPERRTLFQDVTPAEYTKAEQTIADILPRLAGAKMNRPDAALIADEFTLAADLLTHACRRGRYLADRTLEDGPTLAKDLRSLIDRHRTLWPARNRPGGLSDSTARLEARLEEYR